MHFLLYPGDEQNKQKFSQSQVTSENVHKNTMPVLGGLIPIDNFLGQEIKGMKKILLTEPAISYFY